MRLSTTGRTVRLVGALGGGVGWDGLDARQGSSTREADGVDPFGVAEVGLEVETSHVLLGVAVECWLDGVAGVGFDDDREAYDGALVPAIGPSIRAGYAFW